MVGAPHLHRLVPGIPSSSGTAEWPAADAENGTMMNGEGHGGGNDVKFRRQ